MMGDLIFYIAAFVFVIALIILAAWLWRALMDRGVAIPGNNLFKPARDKRIGTVETASLDSRRKLVLVRRDGVEHLIMVGGPVDIVIEAGIQPDQATASATAGPATGGGANFGFKGASLEERLYGGRQGEGDKSFLSND